jgi:hypothetical protein
MTNSPEMLPPEPIQGEELLRLQKDSLELQRQAIAHVIQALADWAADTSAQLTASKALLQKLGITEQQWQQSVAEAKSSSPQGPQSSLPALAELLHKLSDK